MKESKSSYGMILHMLRIAELNFVFHMLWMVQNSSSTSSTTLGHHQIVSYVKYAVVCIISCYKIMEAIILEGDRQVVGDDNVSGINLGKKMYDRGGVCCNNKNSLCWLELREEI